MHSNLINCSAIVLSNKIWKKNITYIFLLNLNPLLGPKCSGSNVIVDQRHADSDTRTTTRDTRTITQDTQTTTNLLNIFTIHKRLRSNPYTKDSTPFNKQKSKLIFKTRIKKTNWFKLFFNMLVFYSKAAYMYSSHAVLL